MKVRTLSDLNLLTPKMCRFLARKSHGLSPMTNDEIARRSGLALSTICKISTCERWDGMTLRVVAAFSEGCGVNLLAPGRQLRFWRKKKLAYLDRATPQQRRMFARLLTDMHNHPG